MADKKTKWTTQQKLAIDERGRDILVSASAGTGKTAVLSGRCVEFLADRTRVTDAAQILVLTFTDAAAEEMRSRIAQQLRGVFAKTQMDFCSASFWVLTQRILARSIRSADGS